MNFLNSEWLLGLGLLPLLVILIIYSHRSTHKRLSNFANTELWKHLVAPPNLFNRRIKLFLSLLGFTFMWIALAQPRWGFEWQELKQKGSDIILALDVSQSMLAEDVSPNRLTRAKREIIDLLRTIEGDRVGLIAFAGASFLQSPLTLDYTAIEIFLDSIDTDLIPVPGTAIGAVIDNAIQAFSKTPTDSRSIILITDGEDHTESQDALIQKAKDANIRLFVMGIGTKEGAPIPKKRGGFLKSKQGEVIVSQLSETYLQKLALSTGGSYVQSVTSDLDIEQIYDQGIKGKSKETELNTKRRKLWNEQFQWFLFAAFLCWFIQGCLSSRSREIQLK